MKENGSMRSGAPTRNRALFFAALLSSAAPAFSADTKRNPYFESAASSGSTTSSVSTAEGSMSRRVNFIALPDQPITATQAVAHSDAPAPRMTVRRLPRVKATPTAKREPVTEAITESVPLLDPVAPIRRLGKPIRSQAAAPPTDHVVSPAGPAGPLPSVTPSTCAKRAASRLDAAYREYSVKAWASAEHSAWESLQLIAIQIDLENERATWNTTPARIRLESAKAAIYESREFVTGGWVPDESYLAGIIKSHHTPVGRDSDAAALTPTTLTQTTAIDLYLDFARAQLVPLAKAKVQAAQAMDLLAAISIGRNDRSRLPIETALCFRRAAFAGQPSNGGLASRLGLQLADMGLNQEAAEALQRAAVISPSQEVDQARAVVAKRMGNGHLVSHRLANESTTIPNATKSNRVPELVQLSPQAFAAVSPQLNIGSTSPESNLAPQRTVPSVTSDRTIERREKTKKNWFSPKSLLGFGGKPKSSGNQNDGLSSTVVDTALPDDQPAAQRIYRSDVQTQQTTAQPAEKSSGWSLGGLLPKLPKGW